MAKHWFAGLHSVIIDFRNYLFDAGWADSIKMNTPVISVGNLTVGGTGKTPVVDLLISHFESKNKKTLIVSRNYKAAGKGIGRVDVRVPNAASIYGDEPTLLASRHPMSTVFVGPHKWRAALQATQEEGYDAIIVDDGFQHRALHRNFDIVLLDATQPLDSYELLPLGRAREPVASLRRADWVIITKANLAETETLLRLGEMIPSEVPHLFANYEMQIPLDIPTSSRVLLLSAIALPETFRKGIEKMSQFEIVGQVNFPDHHAYELKDLQHIRQEKVRLGAEYVLTTAKDMVKLSAFSTELSDLRVIDVTLSLFGDNDRFFFELDKIVG